MSLCVRKWTLAGPPECSRSTRLILPHDVGLGPVRAQPPEKRKGSQEPWYLDLSQRSNGDRLPNCSRTIGHLIAYVAKHQRPVRLFFARPMDIACFGPAAEKSSCFRAGLLGLLGAPIGARLLHRVL